MKYLAVSLSLTTLVPVGAFSIFNPIDVLTKGARELTKLEIIEGVGLPTDTENLPEFKRLTNFLQGSIQTNIQIVSDMASKDSVAGMMKTLPKQEGEKKDLSKDIPVTPNRSEFFRKVYATAINDVIKVNKNDPDPAEGYLYFGNRDFKKILPMLCQVNPFFASALTMKVEDDEKFFELISFNDKPELVDEPLYLSLMREITDDVHRINAKFNSKMELVEITKLDTESGKAVVVPEAEWDYYSSGIIYNILFYASTVHANIHILHYLMTTCIIMATRNTSKSLEKWADIYDDNIAIKYVEVGFLLFDAELAGYGFGPTDEKLVSGKNGFGATSNVMGKVKELLCLWGSLKNEEDFTKKFLHHGMYLSAPDEETAEAMLKEGDILTEYNKHRDNVPKYAKDLTDAMREDDPVAFDTTEEKIKSFMEACGRDVLSIDTVSSWSQLMCLTGLVHGSTLSFTRLILVPEVARWRNIKSETWDEFDASLMGNGFATAQGMTLDRHVFTSSIQHGYKWKTKDITPNLMSVLKEYDEKAEDLKTAYTKEIECRDDFREYGWILTDHCNDGYDGKQHTITTYI